MKLFLSDAPINEFDAGFSSPLANRDALAVPICDQHEFALYCEDGACK